MEILTSVARFAGSVILVRCSRGSRPGLYAVARSARFLTLSPKPPSFTFDKLGSLSPGPSLGRFVQIVFRIEIGDVDFAEIFRRRVDFGLHLVRIGRVIVQLFDANELPRLIYPRVIEFVTIFPAPGASAIVFDAESVASRYDALKGITENTAALRTHHYSLVALRQSQLAEWV